MNCLSENFHSNDRDNNDIGIHQFYCHDGNEVEEDEIVLSLNKGKDSRLSRHHGEILMVVVVVVVVTKFDATEIEPCVNVMPFKFKEKNKTVYVINKNIFKETTVIQCKINVTRTIQVSV